MSFPRQMVQLANAVHTMDHLLDDHAEEDASTGIVTIVFDADDWKKLNQRLDAVDHDDLHEILGI